MCKYLFLFIFFIYKVTIAFAIDQKKNQVLDIQCSFPEITSGSKSTVIIDIPKIPDGYEAILVLNDCLKSPNLKWFSNAMKLILNAHYITETELISRDDIKEQKTRELLNVSLLNTFFVEHSHDFQIQNHLYKTFNPGKLEFVVTGLIKKGKNTFQIENKNIYKNALSLQLSNTHIEFRPIEKNFTSFGHFKDVGLLINQIVGPSADRTKELIYASYRYNNFDIVAIDPENGNSTVFKSPLKDEGAAYGLVTGTDGKVYIGTSSNAHMMRINWQEHKIDDLGKPIASEQYIWGLAVGSDKKIYGCTYPNAKLFRFDHESGDSEDLGRLVPDEMYARTIASSENGFVYIGIGMVKRHLIAYEIATGIKKDILPAECQGPGVCYVSKGVDNRVYVKAGNKFIVVSGWDVEIIRENQFKVSDALTLNNGNIVSLTDNSLTIQNPNLHVKEKINVNYSGKNLDFFRIGLGPGNEIYGSTVLPLNLIKLNSTTKKIEKIGNFGSGEVYSMMPVNNKLIFCSYSGIAPIIAYTLPKHGIKSNSSVNDMKLLKSGAIDPGWRPMAITKSKGENIYIGSTPGYGRLGGDITMYDPKTEKINHYKNIFNDQSIVSLDILPDGRIIGGTNIQGGGGSIPTQKEAVIFIWDPISKHKVFETIPVANKSKVDALTVGSNGLVYGFAGNILFVFDPDLLKVVYSTPHKLGSIIYNSLGLGPKNNVYGLSDSCIFSLNPETYELDIIAPFYKKITGGFAIDKHTIYFISGTEILSYDIK